MTRNNSRECLTPVRAFYLDLAHWAVEDPARGPLGRALFWVGVNIIPRLPPREVRRKASYEGIRHRLAFRTAGENLRSLK